MISAYISGSSSCSVSAAVSTSSFRKMPVRSVPETWLRMSAMSAGCSRWSFSAEAWSEALELREAAASSPTE